MKLLKYIILIAAVCAVFTMQSAKADFVSLLNTGNSAISGFTGPYGTVDVHLVNTTTATVTFTSLTNAGNIYLFGDGSTVAVNVNAGSFSITGVSGSNAGTGFTPGPYTVQNPPGSSQVDGLGLFNGVIDSFDGFTHSSDTVTFTLNNLSGTWSGAANVLIANADGFDAAAHIFVTSSPANAANGAVATGFAGEIPGTVTTPDGGVTAALLGLALAGLAGMRARFGRK
jgi:hypothetical protein